MFIYGKHAISITIEGSSQIGPNLANLLLHINHVLRLDGTGRMMGKAAVQFKVEWHEFAGQMRKHARHHQPRHAIARIDHYLKWLHLVHINEGEDVLDIGISYLVFRHLPGVNRGGKVSSDR